MSRRGKHKRSAKAVASEYFPVCELARRRKKIREEYLNSCEVLQEEEGKLRKNSVT